MAQDVRDVRRYGTAEYAAGPERQPDGSGGSDGSGGERQRGRRNAPALLVSLSLLAALVVGVVLYVAPWASAAGGCGGG